MAVSGGRFHTLEILFPSGQIKTDSLLYREKSHLLIPEAETQNVFAVVAEEFETRFYISSDSMRNLERVQSFFSRLYGAIFEDSDGIEATRSTPIMLKNSLSNVRRGEFYHPRFVRNILDYPSVHKGTGMVYRVTVRAGKQGKLGSPRFNFLVSIGFTSNLSVRKLRDLIRVDTRELRTESRYRIKLTKTPRLRDNLFKYPFNLINFIRVPSENDIIV